MSQSSISQHDQKNWTYSQNDLLLKRAEFQSTKDEDFGGFQELAT